MGRDDARSMSLEEAVELYNSSSFNNLMRMNGCRKKKKRKKIVRSAKGTTWENHKYKDIVDGRYIYDEEADRAAHGGKSQFDDIREANKDKDWQDVIHEHVDNMIKKNPNLNTDMIADAPIEDFANTLKALTYLDVDEMTVGELENMRQEIVESYGGTSDENEGEEIQNDSNSSNSTKNDVSSSSSSSSGDKEKFIPQVNRERMEKRSKETNDKGRKAYEDYKKYKSKAIKKGPNNEGTMRARAQKRQTKV